MPDFLLLVRLSGRSVCWASGKSTGCLALKAVFGSHQPGGESLHINWFAYLLSTYNFLLHLFVCVGVHKGQKHPAGTSSFLLLCGPCGLVASPFTSRISAAPLNYIWRWGSYYVVQVTLNFMVLPPSLCSRCDYRHPCHSTLGAGLLTWF